MTLENHDHYSLMLAQVDMMLDAVRAMRAKLELDKAMFELKKTQAVLAHRRNNDGL